MPMRRKKLGGKGCIVTNSNDSNGWNYIDGTGPSDWQPARMYKASSLGADSFHVWKHTLSAPIA